MRNYSDSDFSSFIAYADKFLTRKNVIIKKGHWSPVQLAALRCEVGNAPTHKDIQAEIENASKLQGYRKPLPAALQK